MRAAVLAIALVACGNSEPANEGKRMPQPPPVKTSELPANLTIAVTVDGTERPPITRDTLATVAPDWADNQRKAWRIAHLVGAPETPDTLFAITGQTNHVTVEFPAVSKENTLVPALLLSQRGQLVAEFVDPKDPFPRFHGEGGRLGRSPESEPRVPGVIKIEVHHRAP